MSEDNKLRIHVFLAHQGVASRRQAEKMVQAGQVKVNGKLAEVGQPVDPETDIVTVNDQPVQAKPTSFLYILVNKPLGYISTTSDELDRQTILDLLPENVRRHRLYPVGRLDQDSRGLMLLTNDGDTAYRLTHPKFQIPKTYQAKLDRVPSDKAIEVLREGVRLSDGKTAPAIVTEMPDRDGTWWEITIHEGRNRQVRRMFERVGYDVYELNRIQLGPYHLKDLHGQPWKEVSAPGKEVSAPAQLQSSAS